MKPAPGSPEALSRAGEAVDSSRFAASCAWLTRTALLAILVFAPLVGGAEDGGPLILVHFLTLVALCAWLARMNGEGSWRWTHTPLDL